MKLSTALLLLGLCLPACAPAQVITTPNLHLVEPPVGEQGWGPQVNANMSIIDAAVGALQNPYQGQWSSTVSYVNGQMVLYGNTIYLATAPNLNATPSSSTSWQALGSATTVLSGIAASAAGGLSASIGGSASVPSVNIGVASGFQMPTTTQVTNWNANYTLLGSLPSGGCSGGTPALSYSGTAFNCVAAGGSAAGATYSVQYKNSSGGVSGAGYGTDATGSDLTGVRTFTAQSVDGIYSAAQSGSSIGTFIGNVAAGSTVNADNPNNDTLGSFYPGTVSLDSMPKGSLEVADRRTGIDSHLHYNWSASHGYSGNGNAAASDTCILSSDQLGSLECSETLSNVTGSGWNNGTQGSGYSGWYVFTHHQDYLYMNAEGILNAFSENIGKTSNGDFNHHNYDGIYLKPGCVAGSDECAHTADRYRVYEYGSSNATISGTTLTGPTGLTATDTELNMSSISNATAFGVGHPILDLTYDVHSVTTTYNSAQSNGIIVYNVTNWTPPASDPCTLTSAVTFSGSTPLSFGSYGSGTFTCSTAVDMTPMVGHKMAFQDQHFESDAVVTSVGTFNSGAQTQTVTANMRFVHNSGTSACLGGLAGRWYADLAETEDYGGVPYYYPGIIYCSTTSTIALSFETPNTVNGAPNFGSGMIFHGAHDAQVGPNGTSLAGNNPILLAAGSETGVFANGDQIEEGGTASQQWWGPNDYVVTIADPYSSFHGLSISVGGRPCEQELGSEGSCFGYNISNAGTALFAAAYQASGSFLNGVAFSNAPGAMLDVKGGVSGSMLVFNYEPDSLGRIYYYPSSGATPSIYAFGGAQGGATLEFGQISSDAINTTNNVSFTAVNAQTNVVLGGLGQGVQTIQSWENPNTGNQYLETEEEMGYWNFPGSGGHNGMWQLDIAPQQGFTLHNAIFAGGGPSSSLCVSVLNSASCSNQNAFQVGSYLVMTPNGKIQQQDSYDAPATYPNQTIWDQTSYTLALHFRAISDSGAANDWLTVSRASGATASGVLFSEPMTVNGGLTLTSAGVIVQATDSANCYQIQVTGGAVVPTEVTCPASL